MMVAILSVPCLSLPIQVFAFSNAVCFFCFSLTPQNKLVHLTSWSGSKGKLEKRSPFGKKRKTFSFLFAPLTLLTESNQDVMRLPGTKYCMSTTEVDERDCVQRYGKASISKAKW